MDLPLAPLGYALCAIPPIGLLARARNAGSRARPIRPLLIIVVQSAAVGVFLLYCAGQFSIGRSAASLASIEPFMPERHAYTGGQPDVIGDSDFYGPKWAGVRRETVLDRVFVANARGREELDVAVQKLAIDAQLAWRCHLRTERWLALVQQRLHMLAADPATHLNDPLAMTELASARMWRIDHATDGFVASAALERRTTCAAIRHAHGVLDADELSQRSPTLTVSENADQMTN